MRNILVTITDGHKKVIDCLNVFYYSFIQSNNSSVFDEIVLITPLGENWEYCESLKDTFQTLRIKTVQLELENVQDKYYAKTLMYEYLSKDNLFKSIECQITYMIMITCLIKKSDLSSLSKDAIWLSSEWSPICLESFCSSMKVNFLPRFHYNTSFISSSSFTLKNAL